MTSVVTESALDSSSQRVLGPGSVPPARLPRRASYVAFGAIVLAAISGDGSTVHGLSVCVAMVAGLILGAWLEQRSFQALRSSRLWVRVLASLGSIPAGFVCGAVGGGLLTFVLPELIEDPVVVLFLFAGLWVTGAAIGSVLILLIDSAATALLPNFRGRLITAFLFVLATAFAVAIGLALLAQSLASSAEGGKITNLSVDSGPFGWTEQDVIDFLSTARGATIVTFAVALIVLIPAVVSVCTKLADAVMERIHPLKMATEAVAAGDRRLRVEESGSRDFRELAKSFNQMIASLAHAERMERAFGVYVSGHVLERIKQQHGDARLPASLRDASVFFADIRGFTSLSERLEPDVVVALLNRYFDRVVAIVEEHDGYLNKFIGDAVVVVFNGPIDQPDHAERAVRCALALQAEVTRLNLAGVFPELAPEGLQVGVGIATGPMLCGNVGGSRQMEYTVIGDTVNLSARLTGKAPAGAVWMSEATARVLGGDFRTTQLEPMALKGKSGSVLPYSVEAVDRAA